MQGFQGSLCRKRLKTKLIVKRIVDQMKNTNTLTPDCIMIQIEKMVDKQHAMKASQYSKRQPPWASSCPLEPIVLDLQA